MKKMTSVLMLTLALGYAGAVLAQRGPGGSRQAGPAGMATRRFEAAAPEIGEPMPDMAVHDRSGKELRLRELFHGRGRGGTGGPGPRDGGPRGGRGDSESRSMQLDADGDGRITRDEAPERVKDRFVRMDTNGDGALDADEIQALAERMRQRRSGG